jgi:hypothetical protein
LSVSDPLVPEQDGPLGGGVEPVVTATVADWVALPPAPAQVIE